MWCWKAWRQTRDHEYLYQHDVGLSRLRRMMQKAAKEQLAMREAQQGAA